MVSNALKTLLPDEDLMDDIRSLNPATGEVIAEIPAATAEDIGSAVARARKASFSWAGTPIEERVRLVNQGGERLMSRRDELAALITQEMGKTPHEARQEVAEYIDDIPRLTEEVRSAVEPQQFGRSTMLVREPHGIVAAITPWNYPAGMPLNILIPALVTGNTVVFKPSELVPLTGAFVADALIEELPADVLQTLQGAGDVGAGLVAADVDMIGFVGSRETGVKIMEAASGDLKRLVLELGGKDPLVVFADADLDAAAECATRYSFENAGQVCCSIERIYVEDQVAEEFEQLVVAKANEWGHDAADENTRIGPMVSDEQRAKVVQQVDEAVSGGARLLVGGAAVEEEGFFYPATVLADIGPDLAIASEETFGPVVSISRFSGDEAEAIKLANDTPYGLTASVYSGDEERGLRVARAIRAGQVGVNRYLGGAVGTPWVGARQSGFGYLGGIDGHRQFTTPKSISIGHRRSG